MGELKQESGDIEDASDADTESEAQEWSGSDNDSDPDVPTLKEADSSDDSDNGMRPTHEKGKHKVWKGPTSRRQFQTDQYLRFVNDLQVETCKKEGRRKRPELVVPNLPHDTGDPSLNSVLKMRGWITMPMQLCGRSQAGRTSRIFPWTSSRRYLKRCLKRRRRRLWRLTD